MATPKTLPKWMRGIDLAEVVAVRFDSDWHDVSKGTLMVSDQRFEWRVDGFADGTRTACDPSAVTGLRLGPEGEA